MPNIPVSSAITSVSSTDPLLQWINNNATSEAQAIDYLEANLSGPPYNVPSEFLFDDIAVYLAASTNTQVNPNAVQKTTTGTTSSSTSLSSIFGIVTGVASAAGMAKWFLPKSGLNPATVTALQGIMKEVGAGALAAYLQYKVFTAAEQAAEEANTGSIAKVFGWGLGATGATMLWLAMSSHKAVTSGGYNANCGDELSCAETNGGILPPATNIFTKLASLIKFGHFSIDPIHNLPAFLFTLMVAGAITTAVGIAGAIVGANGGSGAPITPTGSAVQSMLSQIPDFTQLLPKSSIMFMTAGLTLGSMSYSVTPTNLFQQFSVPTVTLASSLGTATGQTVGAGSLANEIFVQQGAGPNGTDTVLLVTPGPNGTSTVSMFAVDANGYVIGPNGPDTSDLPIFQPTGNGTGVQYNQGALDALLQIPACMSIANDTSMTPQKREAALETCMRANKDVAFIPSPPTTTTTTP